MKKILLTTTILLALLVSCIDDDENINSFTFANAPAVVFNLPLDGNDQYFIRILTNNLIMAPTELPDSLKTDKLQILVSGFSSGNYKLVEYTDTSRNINLSHYFVEANITNARRSQQSMEVYYGTSFGECMGYCKKELKLSRGQLEYFYISSDTLTYPKINCEKSISTDSTDLILDFIDKQIFYNMDGVIGCPDCADGGAEYILVKHGLFYKQIIFEYMNEPEEIRDIIKTLRRFASYSDCNPN